MLEKRYQVFFSTSGEDTRNERLALTQALVSIGCFAWGFEQRTPLSSTLAHRQINECDYVVILLGHSFGEQSITGEYYIQHEYEYAVAQQKPILVFMPQTLLIDHQPIEMQQKFSRFVEHLKQHHPTFFYQTARDLEMTVRIQMQKFMIDFPCQGWVRLSEVQQIQHKLIELEQQIKALQQTVRPQKHNPFAHLPKVALLSQVNISYRLHAYQDGNLTERTLHYDFTWLQLIELFGETFIQPNHEEHFAKLLNDYLRRIALHEVKKRYPQVHAVSRVQVNSKTLTMIKEQLHHHDWIVPIGEDAKQRTLWQLTETGRRYFEGQLSDK